MPDNHLRIDTTEKRKILVVDDEIINREVLGMILGKDYHLLFAENGEEALKVVEENRESLSLILLDLLMPVMSGMDMLKRLKEVPEWAGIPVIVMTADYEAEVASLELGALDFIPKPYPAQKVVLARVRRIIELSEDRQIISSTERDPLTGLYNREFFYNYAEYFDQHHKSEPMDAIVLDINRFHIVNERHGRTYADRILRTIAARLKELVQASGGIVCRREADTFLIYCPHVEDYNRILEYVAEGIADQDEAGNHVRLRMGVYPNVDKSYEMERRFDHAKAAADTVKSNYSKKVAVYDDKLHEAELFSEQLTEDFDRAICEGQFRVFYQPKYDIRGEHPILTSAEALIRWQHPKLGLVSPGVFIPLFEENGLIQKLDRYVWTEAAAQVRQWKDRYGISVPVSINVSRIDMFDPGILSAFETLLAENHLEPEELIPEITESAYTDNEAFIISKVEALRRLGLRVEVDDFGTGYSSLAMISSLPFDALKMDMTFVRNAFSVSGDTRMIELIMDIARYLGVPVVAEGVETKEQLNALKALGCDVVQGYYFSKPVPAEEFAPFIEEKKHFLEESGRVLAKQNPSSEKNRNTENEVNKPSIRNQNPENSLTYARLAQALAADYFSIYYVDTRSDRFSEFTAHDAYEDLGIEKEGENFFNLSRKNILRVMVPEDQRQFLDAFTKENVMRKIRENGAFTITYRLLIDGVPTYVSLKATPMGKGDDRHIVVGVNNINAQMMREQEYEKNLRNAKSAALQDALTGVKSKLAFTEAEKEINERILQGDQSPFAVAVCDVNGLKEVNDVQGHKAGDRFIKDACATICDQFKHSPVFRIGGDEFAVILQNADYRNRNQLMKQFLDVNKEMREQGGLVIACGIAEWQADDTESFERVFERADSNMYENKRNLKTP